MTLVGGRRRIAGALDLDTRQGTEQTVEPLTGTELIILINYVSFYATDTLNEYGQTF